MSENEMTDLDDLKALYAETPVVVTQGRGNLYENAYCQLLLKRGYTYAVPTRRSRGPFDVHGVRSDGRCDHVQCRSGTLSCRSAEAMAMTLEPYAWTCHVGVVHRTSKKEFCEH